MRLGGAEVWLAPGYWRVLDEESFERLVKEAFEHRIRLEARNLRPSGDRLN